MKYVYVLCTLPDSVGTASFKYFLDNPSVPRLKTCESKTNQKCKKKNKKKRNTRKIFRKSGKHVNLAVNLSKQSAAES